ncbi:MAG: hypothetical protein ACXWP5_01005 [Bdellovibrionota bacterium]
MDPFPSRAYRSPSLAFRSGLLAGLASVCVMALAHAVGVFKFDLLTMIGTFFTRSNTPLTWVLGFFIFILFTGVVGLAYAAAFRVLGRSGGLAGASLGVIHWLWSGGALGILSAMHPLIPYALPDPGYFGANLGGGTTITLIGVHLIYGAMVGLLYRSASGARPVPVEDMEQEPTGTIRRAA